jgi:hypothetical protein
MEQTRMIRVLVLSLGWTLAAPPAHAAETTKGVLTSRERACQVGRARAVYDLIVAEGRCLRRCRAGTPGDAACAPPDGVGVASCVRSAEARALRRVFGRSCRRDCPECYGGCTATVASDEVRYTSGLIATFAPLVYCGAAAANEDDGCRHAVATAAARYARRYGRCFARCHGAGCDTGRDVRTAACADRAARRARAAIDARCEPAGGGVKPACYAGLTGSVWVDLVRGAVDAGRPVLFCASPSGAFVDRDRR